VGCYDGVPVELDCEIPMQKSCTMGRAYKKFRVRDFKAVVRPHFTSEPS
jgi:hypothetical protein